MSNFKNITEGDLKKIFAGHPHRDEFHVTSDGQAFSLENDAKNHSKDLADKNIETYNRADVSPSKPKAEEALAKEPAKAPAKAAAKAPAKGKAAAKAVAAPAKEETPKAEEAKDETQAAESTSEG